MLTLLFDLCSLRRSKQARKGAVRLSISKVARASVAGATLAMASVLIVAPGAPAFATPSDCSTGKGVITGWANCTSGTGDYRSRVTCDKPWAPDPIKHGPWKSVGGGRSTAYCEPAYQAATVAVEKR